MYFTILYRTKNRSSLSILFFSSKLPPGETIGLADYAGNIKAGQRDIYYLAAPSRQLAESSPYYESLKVN